MIRPLGPDGIQRRIEEIQRRIEDKLGPQNPDGPTELHGSLSGRIGSGVLKPWNPFGDGTRVEGRPAPSNLKPLIEEAAAKAGVDPALLDALVQSESGYDPMARSRAGALGLSQLMPGTARGMGVSDPFDPAQSLMGGASYLSQMLKRFNGDPRLALAAYNAGPGAVEKAGGIPPYEETRRYVEKVMGLYQARKNG